MKKTKARKLSLHRETLLRLISEDLAGVRSGVGGSAPSCIDRCFTAMCPTTTLVPDDEG